MLEKTKPEMEGREIVAAPAPGTDTEGKRAIAQAQAAVISARNYPRDEKKALDRIVQAFTRPTLAEKATYQYARGGNDIQGASIRAAEAIAQAWGNLDCGVVELEKRPGESTMMAYAHDLETNTRFVAHFQVAHYREAKGGARGARLESDRDIYEAVANSGSRRMRACILRLIPGDVVEAALEQAEKTMRTRIVVTPELVASLIEKFAAFGVTKDHLEKRIQRHLDSITPALVVNLGKIYNSLVDGMASPSEWFDIVAPTNGNGNGGSKSDALADAIGGNERAEQTAARIAEDQKADEPKPTAEPAKKKGKADSAVTEAGRLL